MIDMHLLTGVLLALAVLVGAAIALSVAMLAAASVARHGHAPHGGTSRGCGSTRSLPASWKLNIFFSPWAEGREFPGAVLTSEE